MNDKAANSIVDGEPLAPILRPAVAWPLACLALVAIALAVLRLSIAMGLGLSHLEARLDGLTISGQTVRVTTLKGDPLRDLRVARLAVEDNDGAWLSADDVRLRWRPFDLLRGDFRIIALDVEHIDLMRRPTLPAADADTIDDDGGGWIKRVVIRRWRVARADLVGPPGVGDLALRAEGAAFVEDGVINVQARAESVVDGGDAADVTLAASSRRIDLQVDAAGPVGGALSRVLDVPEEAVNFSLNLQGGRGAGDVSALLRVGSVKALDLIAGWTPETAVAQFDADLGSWPQLAQRYGARIGGRFERTPSPQASWTLDLGSTELSLQARGDELRRLPERDVEASLSLSVRAPQRTFDDLGVGFQRLVWTGSLRWTPDGRVVDAVGALAIRDFAAAGIRADVIEGPLSFRREDSRSQSRLRISPEGVQTQNAALAARLDGSSILALDVEYDSETRIARIRDARADAAGLSVRLNGTVDRQGAGDATLTARVSSLTALGAPGDGALEVALDAESASWTDGSWSLQASLAEAAAWPAAIADLIADRVDLSGAGQWTSSALTVESLGVSSDTVTVQMAGRMPFSRPTSLEGDVTATLSAGASISGAVFEEGGRLTVRRAASVDAPWIMQFQTPRLVLAGVQATDVALRGDARQSGGTGTAGLTAKAATDLGPFGANLEAAWDGASWRASGSSLRFGAWSGAARATGRGGVLETATLDGSFRPSSSPERIDIAAGWGAADGLHVTASTADIALGPMELDAGELKIDGPLQALAWRARVLGPAYDLALSGDASATAQAQTIAVQEIEGDLGAAEVRLDEALALRRDQSGLHGAGVVAIGDGDLDVKIAVADTIDVAVRLFDVPLKAARAVAPNLEANGPVRGDLNFIRDAAGWRGDVELLAPRVSSTSVDAPSFSASVAATRRPDVWNVDARASTDDRFKLEATASVESEPFSLAPMSTGRIDGSLSARGAIDAIAAAALGDAGVVNGAASIDVRVTGRLDAPITVGEFALSDVDFEQAETGVRGRIHAARADFVDDVLSIRPFEIVAPEGGHVEIDGAIAMTEVHDTAIRAKFERFPLIRREDVRASVSGTLNLGGAGPKLTRIDGALAFPSVSAQPSISGVRTPPSLKVDEIRGVGPRPGRAPTAMPDLRLDVTARADNRVFLRGDGVESEWRFDLRIAGSASQPRLEGRAELIRGFARIAGARFALAAGSVTFRGAPEDADLDLRASAPFDGGRAIVRVGGTITSPDVALSSEPPLPDDEIMARVLFGRGSSSLSALQAAQLSLALGEIATGRNLDVVTRLRNRLSLDRFTIEDNAETGASVVGGKYLTDDVYLEVGTAGRTGLERVRIEWSPLQRFAVVSRFDARGDARVSVRWTRDY